MTKEQIVQYIEAGKVLGVQLELKDDKLIGWISVEKLSFNEKLFVLQDEDSHIYKEQIRIKQTPYFVRLAIISKEILDGDDYPLNEDYSKNEKHFFISIAEVENYIDSIGLMLENLKWYSDIIHD